MKPLLLLTLFCILQSACIDPQTAKDPSLEARDSANLSTRIASRQWVESCFKKARPGHCSIVTGTTTDGMPICQEEKQNFSSNQPISYRIHTDKNAFRIELSLHFQAIQMSPLRAREIFDTSTKVCIPLVKSVWDRYGIDFDLTLDLNPKEKLSGPEVNISLYDMPGRSNAFNYYFQTAYFPNLVEVKPKWRDIYYCHTILHETAHLLGLHDEYVNPVNGVTPEPVEIMPWSVMQDIWHYTENIEFFPRHLYQILNPVCPQ